MIFYQVYNSTIHNILCAVVSKGLSKPNKRNSSLFLPKITKKYRFDKNQFCYLLGFSDSPHIGGCPSQSALTAVVHFLPPSKHKNVAKSLQTNKYAKIDEFERNASMAHSLCGGSFEQHIGSNNNQWPYHNACGGSNH